MIFYYFSIFLQFGPIWVQIRHPCGYNNGGGIDLFDPMTDAKHPLNHNEQPEMADSDKIEPIDTRWDRSETF